MTRVYVRLLGPCFKTGQVESLLKTTDYIKLGIEVNTKNIILININTTFDRNINTLK